MSRTPKSALLYTLICDPISQDQNEIDYHPPSEWLPYISNLYSNNDNGIENSMLAKGKFINQYQRVHLS